MRNFTAQLSQSIAELGLSFSQIMGHLLIALALFLQPVKPFLGVVLAFILLDTIAGIYVSYKLPNSKGYQSHKFFNLAPKLFFYLATIILAYLVDRFIFSGKIYEIEMLLTKALTLIWIHNEIKSMDEKSVKMGNRALMTIIRDFISKAKSIKKDLNDIKE